MSWGVLLTAVLLKFNMQFVVLTPADLEAAKPFDLDVVNGPDGSGALKLVAPEGE